MKFQMPRPSGGSLGRTKNILHYIQGFTIFIAWALTIAIWTKGDGIDGRTGWYWGLCWLSIPGLVYLVAVPMWPRARRFGNVYAFATVDVLYSILWASAWICLASYVAQGKSKGSSSNDSKSSNSDSKSSPKRATNTDTSTKTGCDNWAYGNASKCKLSEATTIIGVFIFILFAVTSFMSFRNVMHFRRTGTLPDAVSDPTFAAQSKAAFSSNPAHDFEEDEDDFRSGRGGMGASSRGDQDEDYALLQQSEVDDLGNAHGRTAMQGSYDPTAPAPGGVLHDYNTGYGGAHGQHYNSGPSDQFANVEYTPSEYTAPSGFGGSSVAGYGRRPS